MLTKLKYQQIINTLKSKNLIILYIQDFVEQWENEFYYQCQGMWVCQKRRYKKFSTYLLYELLNSKRSIILTQKFNSYSFGWMCAKTKWKMNAFKDFCKRKNVFTEILKENTENLKIVQLLIGLNLMFFNLIPFSINKMRKLITNRKKQLKELFKYIASTKKEKEMQNLYKDIKIIKNKFVSEAFKKNLKIQKKLVIINLEACNQEKLLPKNYI